MNKPLEVQTRTTNDGLGDLLPQHPDGWDLSEHSLVQDW